MSSSSCGRLTRRTTYLMYGESEVIFFFFSNLDLSFSSVTDKALQPLGWGNAFWMYLHAHSLPHLLTPTPLPTPPHIAGILRSDDARVSMWQNTFPWSRSLCWLCSCLPLRSCAPDDGRPRYGFHFLLTFLPPSATPSSISLPLSLSHCLVLNPPHLPSLLVGIYWGCFLSGLALSQWMVWSFPFFPHPLLCLSLFSLSLSLRRFTLTSLQPISPLLLRFCFSLRHSLNSPAIPLLPANFIFI